MTDIHTEEVTYSADGVEMKAYMAWDSTKGGPRPGILVVHHTRVHDPVSRHAVLSGINNMFLVGAIANDQ